MVWAIIFSTRKEFLVQHHFNWLAILAFCILVGACSSTGTNQPPKKIIPKELSFLPPDVNVTINDALDIQLALAKRNLYLNDMDAIKPIQREQCTLEVSAHRGDYRQPEGSAWAIKAALRNGFNSVEVDIMRLADGNWVNHHDPYTGRAAVHVSGKRMKVERMDSAAWNGLRLRKKSTGELLNIRPLSAYEIFSTFATNNQAGQILNVEIKSDANGYELSEIDQALKETAGTGHYYYSSMKPDVLIKLRGINKDVYLGFIQRPHPDSINRLKRDSRKAVQNDSYYQAHKSSIEWWGEIGAYADRYWPYRNYLSTSALKKIANDLGNNSGLHLDVRNYTNDTRVKSRAASLGMKVYTYSVNGPDYHERQLLKLKHKSSNMLPHGVIIDRSPYHICQRLYGIANKQENYSGLTMTGRYINSLPNDADIDKLYESLTYIDSGYYINMNGKLSSTKDTASARLHENIAVPYQAKKIDDEDLKFSNEGAIRITLEIDNE